MDKIREECEKLKNKADVLHWVENLLPAFTGTDKVDQLPVIIIADGEEIFLGVPKAGSGTGKDEVNAVYETLLKWDLLDEVCIIY